MRTWSAKLLTIHGIRIEIHATFALLAAWVAFEGWTCAGAAGAIWSTVFLAAMFTCVVLHELGHSLVALRMGIGVPSILLLPVGGVARFERIPRQPLKELAITLAGPAVNFLLAGLLVLAWGLPAGWGVEILPVRPSALPGALLAGNLVMGCFNLIPVFPMDGGRILRALLALRMDHLRATRWAANLGRVLAVAGALLALHEGNPIVTALFLIIFFAAGLELKQAGQQHAMQGLRAGDIMLRPPLVLSPSDTVATALGHLRWLGPVDIVLADETGRPAGIVEASTLLSPALEARTGDPLGLHARTDHRTAQAGWPLEILPAARDGSAPRTIIVVDRGVLAGVIDWDRIEEMAVFARRRCGARDRQES